MTKIRFALISFVVFATSLFAQDLKLIPQPKQVEKGAGEFVVTASTKIVIGNAEDRMAAETVAEEIQSATGHKPAITSGKAGSGEIFLERGPVPPFASPRSAKDGAPAVEEERFKEEGYTLQASRNRVLITAPSRAGVFYGAQTLRQLLVPDPPFAPLRSAKDGAPAEKGGAPTAYARRLVCPAVTIKDWPTMKWRGVHDDISRGPIPTLDYMKKQVRTLAEYKINLFSLYMEHVFDYQSQPLIAPKEGAITAAEVKELVAYAQKYYVTILPEQQAFGHLHHVLKNEAYNDVAELPHGHVLTPTNEKTYELIQSMYAELTPLFPGPLFHIGSDETWELGQGQTKQLAQQEGLGKVYLEHLKKVSEIMRPYHKRLMFWGDIAMHYPELLNILPKDVIAVAWEYDPKPNFDSMLKPYKDAGLDLFVAPGANNWNMIFPQLDHAYVNVRNFVRDGQKFGALGMLNTTWDDDGEAIFGLTWPPLVLGAACAWQEGECSIEQFQKSYDWAFYRNQDSTFNDVLENLQRANKLLDDAKLGGAYDDAFWQDPFTQEGAEYTRRTLPAAREMRLAVEHALGLIYQNRARARAHPDTLDPLVMAALRLDMLGMKIQYADEISRLYWDAYLHQADGGRVGHDLGEITGMNSRLEDLRDANTRVRGYYADAWNKENRPYWLGNVLVRYDAQAQEIQRKIRQVREAWSQYHEQATLPAPQELGFYIPPPKEKAGN